MHEFCAPHRPDKLEDLLGRPVDIASETALRHRLMHAYSATDASVVWAIVTSDLPAPADAMRRRQSPMRR